MFEPKFKQSKFSVLYSQQNTDALYHSRYMRVLFLSKPSTTLFNQFKESRSITETLESVPETNKGQVSSLLQKLQETGFLVNAENNESALQNRLKPSNKVHIGLMYLLPTDACNFKCKYCFIEEAFPKDHKLTYMTPETAKKAIDLFAKISKPAKNNRKRVQFYGGEPLLNPELIKFAVKYMREEIRLPDTDISLITNGSLINPDIAEFLKRHQVDTSISLDGPREVNNIGRVYPNGRGTYESAVRGYKTLKEAGIEKVGVSYTVGSHNLDSLLPDIKTVLDELKFPAISFNFITDWPNQKNPFSTEVSTTIKKVLEAFEFLRDKGIYEDKIMRKLRPFVEGEFYMKDCAAIGNQIVIAPNGNIGPCQALTSSREYFTQNVHDQNIEIENHPVFQEWARRMPLNIPKCQDCEAIAICGGGCPYQSKITKGSIWELDERMCKFNKGLLEWMINDAAKNLT